MGDAEEAEIGQIAGRVGHGRDLVRLTGRRRTGAAREHAPAVTHPERPGLGVGDGADRDATRFGATATGGWIAAIVASR